MSANAFDYCTVVCSSYVLLHTAYSGSFHHGMNGMYFPLKLTDVYMMVGFEVKYNVLHNCYIHAAHFLATCYVFYGLKTDGHILPIAKETFYKY